MKTELLLASGSKSRKQLLEEAGIPFRVISHCSRESVGANLPIEERVKAISTDKITCVDMSTANKEKSAFILTGDTLAGLRSGEVFGKPKDLEDAKKMLGMMFGKKVVVVTGCCVERRVWRDGEWKTDEQREFTAGAVCRFDVPSEMMDEYFRRMPEALYACGGAIVEGYGQQFLKSIAGSYSSVLGLPMAELREVLIKLGFFS